MTRVLANIEETTHSYAQNKYPPVLFFEEVIPKNHLRSNVISIKA
jgi:hypothetical protein